MKKLWDSPFVRFLRDAITLYLNNRVPQAAACLAYFLLLTLFPMLICVTALLGAFHLDSAALLGDLTGFLPDLVLDVLSSYLHYVSAHQSTGLFLAGLAGCWFSAAAAFRTITRVMADVYEIRRRSSLFGLAASILFPMGLLLTIGLSLAVVVTSRRTMALLSARFTFLHETLRLWDWVRFLLLFAVFFLFILAVLNMAAPRGTPRFPVLVSSLTSSLALVLSSAVFSWFLGLSSRYSLVYGSLVSLIVLLVWLYFCGQILFLGVVFIGVWYQNRQRNGEKGPPD